jgi:hypothetical protein
MLQVIKGQDPAAERRVARGDIFAEGHGSCVAMSFVLKATP